MTGRPVADGVPAGSKPAAVTFAYWGRRGLSRLVLDTARAALASDAISATISISRQNECFASFVELGDAVVPIDTFAGNAGALLQAWRIPIIRRQLARHLARHRPLAFIELMPHVWSPFITPIIKAAGVRYVTVIHDAVSHPGDYRSASIAGLTRQTLRQADLILTLSETVAAQIETMMPAARGKIVPLFHPDLDFGVRRAHDPPRPDEPWRLAFFGRIMPYKGLPLFLDMVDELRAEGIAVEVGVFGEGALGACAARLSALGAEVVNRWLAEAEIGAMLARFHAVVLSHTEASQSGVAAAAFGSGAPVIATPVGGLVEQVEDGATGVLAARVDAKALAEAAKRLLQDQALYGSIRQVLAERKGERSVSRFVERCVAAATAPVRDAAIG